jgi:hypothetical protein
LPVHLLLPAERLQGALFIRDALIRWINVNRNAQSYFLWQKDIPHPVI